MKGSTELKGELNTFHRLLLLCLFRTYLGSKEIIREEDSPGICKEQPMGRAVREVHTRHQGQEIAGLGAFKPHVS